MKYRPALLLLAALLGSSFTAHPQVTVDTVNAYRLVNVHSGLSLGIAADSQAAGTITVQSLPGRESTRWHFVPEGNGNYLIANLFTGQVIGVAGASTTPGAPVVEWADNGTTDHLWTLIDVGNGQYKLQNVNSRLLLGIAGASTKAGSSALQSIDNGTLDHFWMLEATGPAYPDPLPMIVLNSPGDSVGTHDPSLVRTFRGYSLFATHGAIHQHEARDLTHFYDAGTALPASPAWTNAFTANSGDLWAPDASWHGGKYWLYYAASSFGSDNSAIGAASSATSLPGTFADIGGPVITSAACPGANAIDPAVVHAGEGNLWMSFGSFYGGIYIIQMNPKTGQLASGATCQHVANRIANYNAIEGSYIFRHGRYYYLLVSLDFCCKAVNSTYHIGVGRATRITGPYYDRGGLPMMAGGVTELLTGHGRIVGPGHPKVLAQDEKLLLIYHYYDGNQNGLPALGLSFLSWTADAWPKVSDKQTPTAMSENSMRKNAHGRHSP